MHGQKALTRNIFTLAWPAVATNITTPLLSLVDVAVVGHIGNSVYIGAIAVGATMFNTLYWLFGFLRMGTSGMTAQAYGAGDTASAVKILKRSLLVAIVAAIMLIVLSTSLGALIIDFIDADGASRIPAREYFEIAILGAPGVLVTYALSGWFLGMQDSRPILWMALVTNCLNIVLNLTFVFALHWQLAGVAAATAISQWAGAVFGIIILCRNKKRLMGSVNKQAHAIKRQSLSILRFIRVNSDIFLRTLCLIAVTIWFTHAGARLGSETLAANALIMQLFMLFSYFMDGFAFAGEAMAGKYKGADNDKDLRALIRTLMRIGVYISAIITIIYFAASDYIMALLTDDADTLAVAHDYRLWAVAVPFAGFMSFLWDGIFIGLTKTRGMLAAMAVAMAVFYLAYFALTPLLGNHALWLAFIIYLFVRGLVQWLIFSFKR